MDISCAIFALLTLMSIYSGSRVNAESLGRGLGDEIDWKTLDNGLQEAKDLNKPLMLIIHKSWCGACKSFRPKFAESTEIKKLSKNFVMVNVEDNDEPSDEKYKPDGGYVPRILFLDPKGEVITDIYNTAGNSNYKHFYPNINSLLSSMQTVLDKLFSRQSNEL
ncbi:Thioredoxin domain-containing protein 12 [Chamberlinius hualienensis]